MDKRKLALAGLITAVLTAFFLFDLGEHLSLETLKARQAELATYREARPWVVIGLYGLAYVAFTAVSLPGGAIMTLAGGAIFGLFWGTVIASFASTIGATLAFLTARFLLREPVARRFGKPLAAIDAGIAREGALYLLSVRLVPLFPFFLVNLLMGVTAIRTWTYYWVSQLGMFPATLVFVNAGTQLGRIESLADVASPQLLGSLALLGVLPLAARRVVDWLRGRAVYAGWVRPRRFDRT